MTKVLVLSPCDEKSKKLLSDAGNNVSITYADSITNEVTLKSELAGAEVIIGEPEMDVVLSAPRLKLLQLTMAGTDRYTGDDRFPKDVVLANATGAFGNVISQYVIGAIINICHKFYLYRDQQKKCLWNDLGVETTLTGKRVLIVGAGNIGSSVAKKLSVFDTINIGIRRNISDIPPFFSEMHTLEELDSQLPLADIVVVCIPSSDYTYHIFNEKRFMLMKNDAVFVNVGRGTLVVQNDLIKVMNDGHLQGAAIDVADPEPLPPDSPLWKIENLIITPHISGKSFGHAKEITDRIYEICAANLKSYTEGKPIINKIDFKKFRK